MSTTQDCLLIANSQYFDGEWYLEKYEDVKASGMNPLLHYIEFGWNEMRNPGPYFSTRVYLYDNPDVENECPLLHFERNGKREGRKNRYEIIKRNNYINEKWYQKKYPYINYDMIDPIEHYIIFGWRDGNDANEVFSIEKYIMANPDYEEDMCPFYHFEFEVNKELRSTEKIVVHFWGVYKDETTENATFFIFTTLQKDIYIQYNGKHVTPVKLKKNNSIICFEEYVKKEYKEDCIYFKTDFFEKKEKNFFDIKHDSGFETIIKTLFMWSGISNRAFLGNNLFFYHKNSRVIALNKQQFLKLALKDVKKEDRKYLRMANSSVKKDIILFSEFRDITNDNSWQLFRQCLNEKKEVYFITSKKRYEEEQDICVKNHLLVYNSDEHKQLFVQCKKICCSWTLSDMVPTVFKHNCLLTPFWEKEWYYCPHGISYDKNSNFLTPLFLGQPDKVFCCSHNEAKYFSKRCGLKNIEVIGYPRMDKWQKPNSENILFDFTYRKEYTENYFEIIAETVNRVSNTFPDRKLRYLFHPAITPPLQRKIKSMIKSKAVEYAHASNEEAFNDWFNTSKYLITDYSSVAYDFAYRANSISIYYMPKGFTEGHYDLKAIFYERCCGVITYNSQELINALKFKEVPGYIQRRKTEFFAYLDQGNCARVLEEIEK